MQNRIRRTAGTAAALIALLLVASAPSGAQDNTAEAKIPEAMVGKWKGKIAAPGGGGGGDPDGLGGTYPVKVRISERSASVSYPESSCSVSLKLIEADASKAMFAATSSGGSCKDFEIKLSPGSKNRLSYTSYHGGKPFGSGNLKKSKK